MTGRLEGPSPEAFLNVCSSKLVRQLYLSSETSTLLENGHHGERVLRLPCFSLEVGCYRLVGDLYFNLLYVCMYVIYK